MSAGIFYGYIRLHSCNVQRVLHANTQRVLRTDLAGFLIFSLQPWEK